LLVAGAAVVAWAYLGGATASASAGQTQAATLKAKAEAAKAEHDAQVAVLQADLDKAKSGITLPQAPAVPAMTTSTDKPATDVAAEFNSLH
jgi:hypothetical protein